jgi:hypothetical protein
VCDPELRSIWALIERLKDLFQTKKLKKESKEYQDRIKKLEESDN